MTPELKAGLREAGGSLGFAIVNTVNKATEDAVRLGACPAEMALESRRVQLTGARDFLNLYLKELDNAETTDT